MSAARAGLLTGPVGVGKTTVAERVLDMASRQGVSCGGLLAPAMLDAHGHKVGIWGFDAAGGDHRVLARTDRSLAGPHIGPYSFDAEALAWALGVLECALDPPACELLFVDEIGKLELWQGAGLARILPRLAAGDAHRALILVRESLLSELRQRLGGLDQVLFEVSLQNREGLAGQILRELLAE